MYTLFAVIAIFVRKFGVMEKTWRWFGKKDKITLPMLRQIGVEGIVTALHDVPNGEIWTLEAIRDLQSYIESFGMRWPVVESLPVCESIKYAGADRDRLIENYKVSLANLGKCGIKTVCYNFMPVLDWARTDLEHPWPDGTTSLYFDYARFAYFDIYILQRDGARDEFPAEIVAAADELDKTMTDEDRHNLVENIIVRTQGFVNGNISEGDREPIKKFKGLLDLYKGIDKAALRENLKYFLAAIMPVCDQYDINMCVHPDDPPMEVLGLPRIVRTEEDIDWFLSAVDNPHNGLTFCAGSLSAGEQNDVVAMARKFAPRTHFVHLRSCNMLGGGNFIEAPHTGGRAHLVELCRIFTTEERRRNANDGIGLPMRVDHGKNLLGDAEGGYNPGYGFYGRMWALGQVTGMMAAVDDELVLK